MKRIFLITFVMLIMACSKQVESTDAAIKISEEFLPYQQTIQQAGDIMLKACPGLAKYWTDFETVNAAFHRTGDWDNTKSAYGWDAVVSFTFVVKQDIRVIPNNINALGHTIVYQMGGGQRPGIMTEKEQGQRLCGAMNVNPNANGFLDVIDFHIIDTPKG